MFTTAAPVTVTLACCGTTSTIYDKKLTAIKVGSVTNTGGPDVARPAGPRPSK